MVVGSEVTMDKVKVAIKLSVVVVVVGGTTVTSFDTVVIAVVV